MQFKKKPPHARKIARWAAKRNHLVCVLLNQDKSLLRRDALKKANKIMAGNRPTGKPKSAKKSRATDLRYGV